MSIERYQEALAAGLTKREAGYIGAAQDIAAMCRDWRAENEAFAASIGTTMEALRATHIEQRDALNARYRAWRGVRA